MFKCHRQFMERQMKGGGWGASKFCLFLKKDNHCLGKKKQADFDSDIFAPPLRLKTLLFFSVLFSDLVIFSFDNHSWVDLFCFSQGE